MGDSFDHADGWFGSRMLVIKKLTSSMHVASSNMKRHIHPELYELE
jgi:hypothetical protein